MAGEEGFSADEFPILRVRASSATLYGITEISLGGVDLVPFSVCGLSMTSEAGEITKATITFEVVPDIEMPVSAEKVAR